MSKHVDHDCTQQATLTKTFRYNQRMSACYFSLFTLTPLPSLPTCICGLILLTAQKSSISFRTARPPTMLPAIFFWLNTTSWMLIVAEAVGGMPVSTNLPRQHSMMSEPDIMHDACLPLLEECLWGCAMCHLSSLTPSTLCNTQPYSLRLEPCDDMGTEEDKPRNPQKKKQEDKKSQKKDRKTITKPSSGQTSSSSIPSFPFHIQTVSFHTFIKIHMIHPSSQPPHPPHPPSSLPVLTCHSSPASTAGCCSLPLVATLASS